MEHNDFISTGELAKKLGVSRVTVFKRIKSGKINARKIGRNFFIEKKDLPQVLNKVLSEQKRRSVSKRWRKP